MSCPYSKGVLGSDAFDGPEFEGRIKVPTEDEQLTLKPIKIKRKHFMQLRLTEPIRYLAVRVLTLALTGVKPELSITSILSVITPKVYEQITLMNYKLSSKSFRDQ